MELDAGGVEEHFAQRNCRKLDGQAAGADHAALHSVQQLWKMAMAVVETARRIGDAVVRLRASPYCCMSFVIAST